MVGRRGKNSIDGNFNITLINDPNTAEQNFNPENYDLVLIGFTMSIVDGLSLQ
jgi:DNA-binding response OmpR family regulator